MSPPAHAPEPEAPIFVTGWGRSGTSLLRSMLNAHPRIYLAQESGFHLWTGRQLPWIGPERRLEAWLGSFSFAWLGVDAELVRACFARDPVSERLPEAYAFALQAKADQHGKPRWGDKNPLHVDYLDEIFGAFPSARVIRMMRDPRAVALSHTRMPFSTSSLLLVSLMLGRTPQALDRYADRILTVRLEDLLADRRAVLGRVLDFVGEPWSDAVLDHARHVPADDGIPFPWLLLGDERPAQRAPAWRQELPAAWIRVIEGHTRATMRAFGYPAAELEREPSALERARAVFGDLGEAGRFLARATRALVRLGLRPGLPAAEAQRLLHGLNPRAWELHPDWRLPDPPSAARGAQARRHAQVEASQAG